MRGDGSLYQRHNDGCPNKGLPRGEQQPCRCVWWVKFYFRGESVREPGGPTERDAKRKLRTRIKAISGDKYIGPVEERLTVAELLDALEGNLALRKKSVRSFASHIKAMRKRFGLMRAVDLSAVAVERYQLEELNAANPKAPATINREIGCLRQAFRLAHKQERLSRVPNFSMLPEKGNERTGFVEPATFEAIAANLPPDLADAARFAYLTGWRRGQIGKLRWEHLDWTHKQLMVPGSITKNGDPQTLTLKGKRLEVIERRRDRREVCRKGQPVFLSPYIFHRGDGAPLGDFRKAWAKACAAASLPGLLFHDLRRSAARNFIRAGVDQDVARKITGHKTASMFSRYNITDTRDQDAAFDRADTYHDEQCERAARVVAIGGGQ